MRGPADHCLTCGRPDLQEKQDSSSTILEAGSSSESEGEFMCAAGEVCLVFFFFLLPCALRTFNGGIASEMRSSRN